MNRVVRLTPLFILAVVVLAATMRYLGQGSATTEPVDVHADTTHFDRLADLVAAADLIIEGTVVSVGDGRTITDPADPDRGVRTQLAQLEVERVTVGTAEPPPVVIVEQEAALLDRTPITVNGVAPLDLGQHLILVLVRGDSDGFPYTTPINEQAVFYVIDQTVTAADPTGSIGTTFNDRPVTELRAALDLRTTAD